MTSDNEGPPTTQPDPPTPTPPPTNAGEEAEDAPPALLSTKRRRFSLKDRMAIIRHEQRLTDSYEMTRREVCAEVNIHHHSMHIKWMKHLDEMTQQRNVTAKSLCHGRPPCLEACKDNLLRFIFEHREQGMAVSVSMVIRRAKQILPQFALKSGSAQYHSALRFVRSQGLVLRLGTNESQRLPAETAAEALDHITNVVRPKVVDQPGRHQDFILNMDQTPVPFT